MGKFSHKFKVNKGEGGSFAFSGDGVAARIDFLSERLLRVAYLPDGERVLPTYSVCPDGVMPKEGRPRLSAAGFSGFAPKDEGDFCFKWGEYSLTLSEENLLLQIEKNSKVLLADRGPLAVNLGGEFGRGQKHYLKRERGERIYGLGDKSGDLDKSGRAFRMDCCDAMGYDAASSDPLYKHIPFYICENSAGCYGLFYDTHARCSFNFGEEISNYTGEYKYFSTDDGVLVYYILLGDIKEIVSDFSRLTGGVCFPPKRTLLYSGSTMAYTDAPNSDELLRGFADRCEELELSCGGFYLSSGYTSIGEKRYVFNWNYDKIPSPKGLAEYYHEKGIELIANIKPIFLTDHPLYRTIAESGWFLKYPDGTPALVPFWDGLGSFFDFTNPDAYAFWKKEVCEELLKKGIDYTWNDNNEYEVLDESVTAFGFGEPVAAFLMKPVFPLLMTMASREAQEEFSPNKRQFLSARSGPAGLSRVAATWSGDNRTEWKTLRYNHKMGLTMSLSGLFNFGHDIGGFAGGAPERELFLRWLQHGAFMPRFTIHSWNDDNTATTPWFYPDALEAVKRIFAFRRRLLPYLYDALYRAHKYSEPIIRPLIYDFPDAD
ncbi:MAG: alpha-glucosidase, partial [Ruminococcaceae bacterium]|nr:alpha-glucosidase [Oscillospiraceae bacterium]